MSLDPFYLKSQKETENMLREFWSNAEYLSRIRILLRFYEKLNITKIESLGVNSLWRKLSLEQRKNVYIDQYKYQI